MVSAWRDRGVDVALVAAVGGAQRRQLAPGLLELAVDPGDPLARAGRQLLELPVELAALGGHLLGQPLGLGGTLSRRGRPLLPGEALRRAARLVQQALDLLAQGRDLGLLLGQELALADQGRARAASLQARQLVLGGDQLAVGGDDPLRDRLLVEEAGEALHARATAGPAHPRPCPTPPASARSPPAGCPRHPRAGWWHR